MKLINPDAYVASDAFCRAMQIPQDRPPALHLLGQGEYNRNWVFCHPVTGHKLVLRQSTASQMHLRDQIGYEFDALRLLEASGRTPKPVFVDRQAGFLVEEYLPGRPLDYRRDLRAAARCLARIHAVPVLRHSTLLGPPDPVGAIRAECGELAKHYLDCPIADAQVCTQLRFLLNAAQQTDEREARLPGCILNTELNSGNFLVNGADGPTYLVDWEKPILGECAQDLGHFLAPTTTFWKTDVLLSKEEKLQFLRDYHGFSEQNLPFDALVRRTQTYERINCLRGLCWCAMAWVEYQGPDRPIRNGSTYEKICAYLSPGFLEWIRSEYFAG